MLGPNSEQSEHSVNHLVKSTSSSSFQQITFSDDTDVELYAAI